VVAHTDDVTIFVSSVTDFAAVEDALRLYEKATGACINPTKSRALAFGGWRVQETLIGIPYHQSVIILGITFWGTIAPTTTDTWARITGKVRVQAKKAYDRDTNLAHRITYVHTCLLSRLWYAAQKFVVPKSMYTEASDCRVVVHMEKNHL
jgi:hypothetical protein